MIGHIDNYNPLLFNLTFKKWNPSPPHLSKHMVSLGIKTCLVSKYGRGSFFIIVVFHGWLVSDL